MEALDIYWLWKLLHSPRPLWAGSSDPVLPMAPPAMALLTAGPAERLARHSHLLGSSTRLLAPAGWGGNGGKLRGSPLVDATCRLWYERQRPGQRSITTGGRSTMGDIRRGHHTGGAAVPEGPPYWIRWGGRLVGPPAAQPWDVWLPGSELTWMAEWHCALSLGNLWDQRSFHYGDLPSGCPSEGNL